MKNTFKNKLVVIMLLLLSFNTNAQDPDDPLSGDPGAVPIRDYVPLMVVAAVGLGYFLIKRQQTKHV